MPLHGANLIPPIEGFRAAVLDYIDVLAALDQRLLGAIAVGLDQSAITSHNTAPPTRRPVVLNSISGALSDATLSAAAEPGCSTARTSGSTTASRRGATAR